MSIEAAFYNTLGVVGCVILLFGFYRVNSGKWTNRSFWYELDNVIGASLLVIYQIHYHAYISVVLNMIWAGIAAIGLSVFFRRAHTHRKRSARRKA